MNKKIICIGIVSMFLLTGLSLSAVVVEATDVSVNNLVNERPSRPVVKGPTSGKVGDTFTFTAVSEDPEGEDILYVFLLHKVPAVLNMKYMEQELFPIQEHTEDEGELFEDLQANPSKYTYCQSGTEAEVNFKIDGIGAAGEYRIGCYAVTSYNGENENQYDDEEWQSYCSEHFFKVKISSSNSIKMHPNLLILKFLENSPILSQLLHRLPALQ